MPGDYYINVLLGEFGRRLDEKENVLAFKIIGSDVYNSGIIPNPKISGITWTPHEWEISWK